MIIRTSIADRLAAMPKKQVLVLSEREKRRLKNTDYAEPDTIKEKPISEVDNAQVREEHRLENEIEPGTIQIKSKALDELNVKPKKKYKIISIG